MTLSNSSKEFEKAVYEAIVYGIKNTTPHRLLEYEKRDVELAVTELIAAHHKASQELVRETLLRLKQEHDDTCGATYPENLRDNCKYEDIVDAELFKLNHLN